MHIILCSDDLKCAMMKGWKTVKPCDRLSSGRSKRFN